MPRLRVLSGEDVIRILAKFGFSVFAQRGSHVKLRREVHGRAQTLTIPNHVELDRGTLRAILTQACRYIPEDELRPHFYSE
ncbi:MAG: type II toxin-antitoxin system HicA family toxin [Chloroflexi bacterium]|nr:type II toxin-antitoxin system HicA family toxin [Chloroflexota bacterium]